MKKILFLFVLLTAYALNSSATIYYVSNGGNDSNNGLSWATAKATINAAIDSASAGDSVFVAVGTYSYVTLKSGVSVFGGFIGMETSLSQRQQLKYGYLQSGLASTIINSTESEAMKNSFNEFNLTQVYYACIYAPTFSSGLQCGTVDGFVVDGTNLTLGNAVQTSIYLNGGWKANNCTFKKMQGYAIALTGSAKVTNCRIVDNLAAVIMRSSSVIDSCEIIKNGYNSHNRKLAIINTYSPKSTSSMTDRVEIKNTLIATNILYHNSSADGDNGTYSCLIDVKRGLNIKNCTIVNNQSIVNRQSSLSIVYSGYLICASVEGCNITNSIICNNYVSSRNGNSNIVSIDNTNYSNSIIQNTTFANNYLQVYDTTKSYSCIYLYGNKHRLIQDICWGNVNNSMKIARNSFVSSTPSNYIMYYAGMNISTNRIGVISLDTANSGNDSTKNYVRFVRPTTFAGAATNSADSLAIMQADWHLDSGSACIDAGYPYYNTLTYQDSTDLDGNHRVSGGRVDIGAYEYPQADAPQQIVWSQNLQGKRLSEGFVVATATATSGLPVTYTSGNTRVATVSHDTIFFQSRGNATITATQWGDSVYMPATPLGKMLTVLDTIGVYDTIPVYDTVRTYDTVHTQINDTLWHNDTIWHNDTLWTNDTIWTLDTLTVLDTTWTHLFDTIPVLDTTTIYIYDTIHVYDTIHIYDTTHVSIQGAEAVPWKIGQSGLNIIVSGAEGETVRVYDVSGRCLHVQPRAVGVLRFRMPTAGVYLVQVGGSPAQRIVLAVRE